MAANSRALPAELLDSVRRFFGPSLEIVRRVRIEGRLGRLEERILVLTKWRMNLLSMKCPAKIESTFNFLEIRNLIPVNSDQVLVETDKTSLSVIFESLSDLHRVMGFINFSLSKIFPSSPPSGNDGKSLEAMTEFPLSPECRTCHLAPPSLCCGGFSETYAALCDYNGVPCREDVQWDVDTIYHSQDTRHFNILDFSHLNSRDLALIIAALAYNHWFIKLSTKDLKLGSEVIEQVIHTMSRSRSIEHLEMENTGLKMEFALKLTAALSDNPYTSLTALNLANNPLEDKGVSSLSQFLAGHHRGLRYLNLSRTSLTHKGLVPLAQTLSSNQNFANTLTHLDLSRNAGVLATDDASHLYNFLGKPNVLLDLNLSGTDCSIDTLFGALVHGCCTHLGRLQVSNNVLSHRKAKEPLPSMKTFFGCAFSLTYVNLSGTKMSPEALSALFQGLASNPHLSDLHLDLSSCELRGSGATVIGEYIGENRNIRRLELAHNGLEADLVSLLTALRRNRTIHHLGIGRNFNLKAKTLDEILHALVQLFQDEDCCLRSLSLAHSRLKSSSAVVINALGSNSSLTEIDLSGNSISDLGARMLAKALLINSTLRTLSWDRNNVTAAGFMDIANALETNYTLKVMPIPLSDLNQTYRNHPEKTEEALHKIQAALLRNSQGGSYSGSQAIRLQQGLMTGQAEQMIDRLCVKVQNDLNRLKNCPLECVQRDARLAKDMVKDARNARALFPSLSDLSHVLTVDGPIRQKLDSVSRDVSEAVDKEVQMLVESMLTLSRELCPLAMDRAESRQSLGKVTSGFTVSRSFIQGALHDTVGHRIHRKLSEMMLAVVTSLTNCIMDEILQELYRSHKTLSQHIVQLQRRRQEEALSLELNQDDPSRTHPEEGTDDELTTSIDTLAIRRQTAHCRRIRPVSTFLSAGELEGEMMTEEDSMSGRMSTSTTSSQRSQSLEGLSDLPTEGQKLLHQTRIRPKPHRNNRRPPRKTSNDQPTREEGNGGERKLDEGLENFYTWGPVPPEQAGGAPAGPQTPPNVPSTSGPKKPRPRRRGGLFKFMRGRSSQEEASGSRGSDDEEEEEEEGETAEDEGGQGDEEQHGEGEVRNPLPRPGLAPGRQAEREGPRPQIVARRVRGVPLPGMGGSQYRQVNSDSLVRVEDSLPNGPACVDRSEGLTLPLLSPGWPARGQSTELPDGGRRSVKKLHREIPDRRDPHSLPPPPPPPPQEAKPTRITARCGQHPSTAGGGGESPREGVPPDIPGSLEIRTPSESGTDGNREEGAEETRRRILLPPTSRIPATTKVPRSILPEPPKPPPAESKPRLRGQEEGEGKYQEGVTQDSALEGHTQESTHPEGRGRREAPIKPRRSRRGHVKMRAPSESCSLSDDPVSQSQTDSQADGLRNISPDHGGNCPDNQSDV